jgi:hypothetical protein
VPGRTDATTCACAARSPVCATCTGGRSRMKARARSIAMPHTIPCRRRSAASPSLDRVVHDRRPDRAAR